MKTILTIAAITTVLTVQASGTFSLFEINPLHGTEEFIWTDSSRSIYGAGELSGFKELNGKLYFTAQNAFDDVELWATDGTQGGTVLVKDINPTGSSQIANMVKVGNRLMFMAADNNNWDFDLWSTDGTLNGTVKVADLNQSWNNALSTQNISVMGNRLLFCTQTQLMITDGTPMGTDSLLALTSYSQGFGYCELNNQVYFVLPNSNGQQEIWRTDGTESGTQQIINLTTALNITSTNEMLSFNGKIYLSAALSGEGPDLYSFDGNLNGQLQRVDLITGGNAYPGNFTMLDNALYFTASNMTTANLYRITTTNSAPQELISNASYGWLNNVTFANNSIYFTSENQIEIHRIDLNNLNHSITQLHGYSMPYYFDNTQGMLVGAGGKVFLALYDSITHNQILFEANEALTEMSSIMPADANTSHPFSFILGCGTADIFDFRIWNDKLVLPANFNDAGRELWMFKFDDLNGVETGKTENLFTIFPNPSSGDLTVKTNSNGYCDQQFTIINVKGEIVLQKTLSGEINSINLSLLSSGNYFATLTENGKAIGTKKLVLVK